MTLLKPWVEAVETAADAVNQLLHENAVLAQEVAKLLEEKTALLETLRRASEWSHSGHGAFPAKQCGLCAPIIAAIAKAVKP